MHKLGELNNLFYGLKNNHKGFSTVIVLSDLFCRTWAGKQ